MRKVKFGNDYWYVLKEQSEKLLLVSYCHWVSKFMERDIEEFFNEVRKDLNVTFYDSCFSEEDKKHILIVTNKYPVECYAEDELGFMRESYKMEQKKDRIFPLKYNDAYNLSLRELERISAITEKNEKIILLPSDCDSRQSIPAISCDDPLDRAYEVKKFSYNTLGNKDSWDDDYTCYVLPAVWVDKNANLKER